MTEQRVGSAPTAEAVELVPASLTRVITRLKTILKTVGVNNYRWGYGRTDHG
jgi:hypothetical protein